MSSQPVEANVVLTADNSQYDQSMNQSSMATSNLGQSVDTLGSKISKLTKTAGKSLIGISAADVALIGGATAAWSSYEKQMSRLQAQSAVLGRTTNEQNKLMKDYTASVKALRTEYGTTTTEAANLVQTLSKITNMRQSTGLKDLSKVFVDMSNATGESSEGLASSLTNLQKLMGTPISAKTTRQYADQFTYLAAQTNTSAQGLIDFTAQLAPAGRQIGINSKQMAGWATAFSKAGQDGGPAAQVFTKITTDIAHSMATGSPEIAHYANLLGITQKQFKALSGNEQGLQIFEQLQKQGKGASTELARLGLDGPRSIRSIQALLQGGSLRQTLGLADTGPGSASAGAAARGGAAATHNMSTEMAKLKDETQMLAETFGSMFGPAIEKFVSGMVKAMKVVNDIAAGPLGQMVAGIMKIVAPFAAGAGAVLLFAGALLKLAGVFAIFRNSMAGGVREGFKGGGAISGVRTEDNQYLPRSDREVGAFGQKLSGVTSDKPGTWLQRAQYNTGIYGGRTLRGIPGSIVGGAQWAWEKNPLTGYMRSPGEARSLGSYMAGGLGRAIDMAVTPQFDQMRYDDPTKREAGRMVGQIAPFSKLKDRMSYVGGLADEHLANRQINALATERSKVAQEPLMTDSARQARMDELKQIEDETKVRRDAAIETKAAALKQIEATKTLTSETRETAVGFKGLKESLIGTGRFGGGSGGGVVGGAGGGILGAAKLTGKAFMASGMAYPAAGLAATAAVSATGSDSKMLQLGAMGLMMGPAVAGIGAITGAVIDMTSSNKKLEESLASLKSETDAMIQSGTGLANQFSDTQQNQQALDKTAESRSAGNMWKSTGNFFGSVWNWGNRNVDGGPQAQDQAAIDAERKRGKNVEGAARDLAAATGTKITGTRKQQLAALDEFMGTGAAQRFKTAKIDPDQLFAARQKAQTKVTQASLGDVGYDMYHNPLVSAADINRKNQQAYQAMLDKLQASSLGPGVHERLQTTAAGRAMDRSPAAQEAIKHQENIQASYKAVSQMYDDLSTKGKSNIEIMHSSAVSLHDIGDENTKQFELQMGLFQKAQQNEQMQMPMMTRAQQFQSTIGQMGALSTVQPTTAPERAQLEQQKMTTAQGVVSQVDYVKQMLLMQDQYEISKKRAETDFGEQQSYQLQDYNLQRSRAEYQFNLTRDRGTADYYRNVRRANTAWDLQRKRQEQDFNHQTTLAAQQMAISVYNVYQRVQVERTSSAEWLIANAHDQMIKMQEQEANLKKLRREGLSDASIQAMQLTDPGHAQEAARLASSMTRGQIAQANKVLGDERQKAAKALYTDPSGLEQQERLRGYRRSRSQALHDHNVSMTQSREDFMRQLRQQKQDFALLMKNQDTDFQTSVTRQEHAYKKSMHRSAEDLANAGKEISGSIESILKQGSTKLTGYAQDTAQAALKTFQGLKTSTRPVAIAIMKDLSEIFGFEYKVPKLTSNNVTPPAAPATTRGGGTISTGGHTIGGHDGMVVPGWTPGRDTHQINVGGGEAVMRPEWTRAVGGEKAVDAMNHKARYGGFATGGVFRPIKYPITGGLHDVSTGYPAVDISAPSGTPVYAVADGKIVRSYDIRGYEPRRSAALGQDGYKSYGRVMYLKTDMGPEVLYAHLSQRGFAANHRVAAGDPIGLSGATGYVMGATGAHLHFGDNDGNPEEFFTGKFGKGTISGSFSGGTDPRAQRQAFRNQIASVLKDRYHAAEKAAHALQGEHPLFPGDISTVINRLGRRAVHQMVKKYGMPGGGDGGLGGVSGNYGANAQGVWNALLAAGFTKQQAAGVMGNMQSESGFDPFIVQGGGHSMNPGSAGGGGYGLVQWTPGSKLVPYLNGSRPSVASEVSALAAQLSGRGPSPESAAGIALRNSRSVAAAAQAFELKYERHAGGIQPNRTQQAKAIYAKYAADGGVFNHATNTVIGEAGPEAVIPLNDRGGEFLTKAMLGAEARGIGMGSSPMRGGMSVYNTRIDKSTNFTGPITVQANNPAELLAKLQARQRVMALSRPSLTGSAA